ncbi:MAG TPA: glycosyltransferase [Acidocella sp.]|jgi:glycosyltransferase involved in cell wall biosynthesis|nr:glycosyltransferase [Acidocella sp.]
MALSLLRHALDWCAGQGLDARPALRRARLKLRRGSPPVPGLVSIILPVRNRAGRIGKAASSVLAQSYRNWELLILDDGSADSTHEALRPYLRHPRILYFRLPPRGAAAARNSGLSLARGGLIAYLDSDNEWEPDFLQGMVPAFDDPAVQSAYGILLTAAGETFEPFDRERLLVGNHIDLNIFLHRRDLFTRHGGFDESLARLLDWDLVLRYTQDSPALPVPVRGAYYRTDTANRISEAECYGTAYQHVRAKWRVGGAKLRVLYALSQYPQASETYIEAEIAWMRRQGVHVEVWSDLVPCTPHASHVPVHNGSLQQAIDAAQPDIVHSHWLNVAGTFAADIAASGLPLTARSHGFDMLDGATQAVLAHPNMPHLYLYPHHAAAAGLAESKRVRLIWPGFDTSLISPAATPRDKQLVLRAAAGLPSKDLPLFMELAKRFPSHRFVLAVVACTYRENYIAELLALRREMKSPVELCINMKHEEVLTLMKRAGIYLHTALPPDEPLGTPLGMPISIAEAMASGCYVITRNFPDFQSYTGEAGAAYGDIEEAEALIAATAGWSEEQWRVASRRARERGWSLFTGEASYYRIYRDWLEIAAARQDVAAPPALAGQPAG